jgi:hypothetical protein
MTDPRLTEPRNQRKKQTRDGATKDPMQMAVRDALIGFMAATAQAQAEATKEAQRAGIEHAKANGESYRGRKPSYDRDQLAMVQDMLGQSANIIAIAKANQPEPTNGLPHQGRSRCGRGCTGDVGSRIALSLLS